MPKRKVKYTPSKISSRVGQGVFIKKEKVKHRAFKALLLRQDANPEVYITLLFGMPVIAAIVFTMN